MNPAISTIIECGILVGAILVMCRLSYVRGRLDAALAVLRSYEGTPVERITFARLAGGEAGEKSHRDGINEGMEQLP